MKTRENNSYGCGCGGLIITILIILVISLCSRTKDLENRIKDLEKIEEIKS